MKRASLAPGLSNQYTCFWDFFVKSRHWLPRFLPPNDSLSAIRRQVEERTARKDATVPTSLELPLSPESKLVLQWAAQEADGLSHDQIDELHLLLGLLHEEAGLASEILLGHGLEPAIVRQTSKDQTFARPKAIVSDEETAMRIAEAIWIPIFGQELIVRQKPFRAKLENDVWTVKGSLPEGCTTGAIVARISKYDGAILETGRDL
jgi:hypothetical protein